MLDRAILESTAAALGGLTQTWLAPFMDLYANQATPLLAQLKDACQTQDFEKVSYAAHTLKSSSASLGLSQVSEYCQQLEQCGRLRQGEKLATLQAKLEQVFEPSVQALEQLSESLPA